MAEGESRSPRRRSSGTLNVLDGDPAKKFSSAVQATIRSVRKHWPDGGNGKRGRNLDNFVEVFAPFFDDMQKCYPGAGHNKDGGLKNVLDRLEHQRRDINFRDFRAFANYIGLPTGLFLFFTHVLADAKRGASLEALEDLINSSQAALTALSLYLKDPKSGPSTLYNILRDADTSGLEYAANIDALRAMSDAFKTPLNVVRS